MAFPPLFIQRVYRQPSFGTDHLTDTPWYSDLALPVYVSFVSAVILLCQAIAKIHILTPFFTHLGFRSKNSSIARTESTTIQVMGYVEAHGGFTILAAEISTLIGTLELLRVSLSRFLVLEEGMEDLSFVVFGYTTVLSLFVILSPRPTIVSRHVTFILVISWLIYFIRDVVPFMTYTESPADGSHRIWELIAVLSFTGVVLPLITPRRYTPFNASDPMPPNPEQTASWLSLILFTFIDPTVWKAYRSPRLQLSELPPLADSDLSRNLVRTAFPHLDPYWEVNIATKRGDAKRQKTKPRHIFLMVAYMFRRDLVVATFLILLNSATTLLSPYVLKRLLEHLESGGKQATVKPWVWIVSLFLAPFTNTLVSQQYQMVLARATVQLEAIFTQLILQHALRVRMIASGNPETTNDSRFSTAAQSIAEASSSQRSLTPIPTDAESTEVHAPQASSPKALPAASATDASKSLVGRMNNLISSDLQAISRASEFMQVFLAQPAVIVFTIGFLYTILGWSALVGALVLVALMPLPVTFSRMLQSAVKEGSQKTDDRVETVTETMSVIRMIKIFGWDSRMSERIDKKREVELSWVWWNKIYTLCTDSFHFVMPAVTMCITFSVYALVMEKTLDAATVFSSIALFDILRRGMMRAFTLVPMVIRGNVSLGRIDNFLHNTELLDEFSEHHWDPSPVNDNHNDEIGFHAAAFSWSSYEVSGSSTPSSRRFRLQIDEELLFKRGHMNLIIGPTGSGKTSLLMALLGEMHFTPSSPGAWFSLPRARGVAYAAQESWVMNATIKENILFNAPYDEDRYNKVIYQCSLTRDLELLKAGDRTELGEKGLTLSGGQKARITLARAVYSSADILLLDDVLAALDVHTAKWIVDKCFVGDLLRGRTVLLVTHNVSLAAPISDFVVSLSSDGRILSKGTMSEALAKTPKLEYGVKEARNEKKAEQVINDDQEADVQKIAQGKLIIEEESAEGHISWESIKMYLVAFGGKRWLFFWVVYTSATFFECWIEVLQPWLLGSWATQYERYPPEDVDVPFYLTVYVGLVILMLLVYFCAQTILVFGALKASASLHKRFIDTILGTTLRWLDKTPTSRIITRVTQDVAAIDSILPDLVSSIFEIFVILIVRFVAILLYSPSVGLFALLTFALGGFFGNIYIKSQLSVKREMSKAKAPVMAHFGASIEGITSIRAYGVQDTILQESFTKVDSYSRASRVFNDFSRWIAIRVDAFGGWFTALLGVYFVYAPNTGVSTANSAFTLTLSVGFAPIILYLVQMLNMFEVNGNSLERLQEYMVIEQEVKPHTAGIPPAHWPSTGAVHVKELTARYSPDGPEVLRSLSFDIRSGERVGIVGRTGSGKSSLTLALLRCIITEGNVWYDGINTRDLNLAELRERVTIIPQMPELLSGSLRRNLDPFDQFDDATLNSALRDAGLYSLQREDDEARLVLDSIIARGGSNLSVGQRQIIALARAMVRQSKLLILDEATSAIDYETDAIIQTSLRTHLGKDVTVMTVAHRLQTIMDADRIMVLDAGEIVEFDSPRTLLQKDGGFLRALVDESGDRESLYAVASGRPQNLIQT